MKRWRHKKRRLENEVQRSTEIVTREVIPKRNKFLQESSVFQENIPEIYSNNSINKESFFLIFFSVNILLNYKNFHQVHPKKANLVGTWAVDPSGTT